ncbi:hypothetical protein HAX54_038119 [Datura stramonium]|uniref:Uncharacterized protein n=1 Tax=Datura stramonium TaxID=4076 RepID=A0ABS8VMJ7_DATST|nr:hypothetical protein [Datura stramonium]
MAPKVNKGKEVSSSSHGSKRAMIPSEEEHEDMSMAPPPLRRYGLRWVTEKEGKKWFKEHKESKYSHDIFIDRNCLSLVFPHMVDRILTLGLGFMFNALGDCNLNMVREFLANWMPKERGVDVTKTKESEGINSPVLTVNECNARIDNMLSHLYGMQMLQLRLNGVTEEQVQQLNIDYPLSKHSRAFCRVCPGYEEPLDEDVAIKDEMTRVDSNIESSDYDEEDSEMGEAALSPTDDEE